MFPSCSRGYATLIIVLLPWYITHQVQWYDLLPGHIILTKSHPVFALNYPICMTDMRQGSLNYQFEILALTKIQTQVLLDMEWMFYHYATVLVSNIKVTHSQLYYFLITPLLKAIMLVVGDHHRWCSHFNGEVFNLLILLIHWTPLYSRSDGLQLVCLTYFS